jgi:hypothetical protein
MASDPYTRKKGEYPVAELTWYQGVRPTQICKGATQAVVDSLMGGSGPKSLSGSSWWNLELGENGKDTVVLDWFMPLESKTLRPV